jgi:hypothetical protein
MKALTIYESLDNRQNFDASIGNISIHKYFDSMFIFLAKEIPAEDVADFLDEYEKKVTFYYKKGLSVFDAAIKLRQYYEKFLHRFDFIELKESVNFERGQNPIKTMGIGNPFNNLNFGDILQAKNDLTIRINSGDLVTCPLSSYKYPDIEYGAYIIITHVESQTNSNEIRYRFFRGGMELGYAKDKRLRMLNDKKQGYQYGSEEFYTTKKLLQKRFEFINL